MDPRQNQPVADPGDACASCATLLRGPYCSECGLRRIDGRITVRGTFGELGHHLTSMDSALWRTLRDLALDPAEVVRRYLRGDRRWILSPAKLAFLAATVYGIVTTVFQIDVRPVGAQVADPRAVSAMRVILGLVGYLLFLYLLPTAIVLRGLFRRPRLLFAEAYVALLFWISQYLPFLALLGMLGVYEQVWGFWGVRVVGWLLLARLVHGLFETRWPWAITGSFVVMLASQAFAMAAGVLAMLAHRALVS